MKNVISAWLLIGLVLMQPLSSFAWTEHPLIVYPILRDMPEMAGMPGVTVKSIQQFLEEEEAGLAVFLNEQEQWARDNIRNYAPRPDALQFRTGAQREDIIYRFLHAIRINPEIKLASYLHLLPGEDCGMREHLNPHELTPLQNPYEMLFTTYVGLEKGEQVSPIHVLATATDEPDYGFDLGLFEDNNTWWGKTYGFGEQSFGNPKLEYGSQAPFHMGFYHEARMVFVMAPFLKRTYVEYRIHLFRGLARYAFSKGQDYWGWRFLGWATHYLNDMSMPYHTSVLPAKGPLAMIWINVKAVLGFPRSRNNAIQLLSNRHTVYEYLQWTILRQAHEEKDTSHPFLQALRNPASHVPYYDGFARDVAAAESAGLARQHDRKFCSYVPAYLVSDPYFFINSSAELEGLVDIITEANGEDAVRGLTLLIAERYNALSMHTRSFILSVISEMEPAS